MKFKNEKLDLCMMCSVGACRKIFGSLQHLKHHYKVSHPDAIFEVDFPHDDFIMYEQRYTKELIDEKKRWIKKDVELMKQTFVKKNTLFKVISDNYKENEDYDPILIKKRRYERKELDLKFYQEFHQRKIDAVRYTIKEKMKSSGQ